MDGGWRPYPEVGLPEIDAEHRDIAARLRELLAAVIDDDRERTVTLGGALVEAALVHFAHEDALMRAVEYGNAERHQQIHRDFLTEAKRQIEGARQNGLSADLLRWVAQLDQWLYRHVMTEDMWLAYAVKRARAAAAAAGQT